MTLPTIDASILFERRRCRCCDCCDGYCPDNDVSDRWDTLIGLSIGGRDYLGTNRVTLRADVLTGIPAEKGVLAGPSEKSLGWATVPSTRPSEFTGRMTARATDMFDRARLTCHDGGDIVHLYVDQLHVGWTKPAKPDAKTGIDRHELPTVRAITARTGLDIDVAAVVMRAVLEVVPGV